ncbi:MAG: hypothetical protein ABIZ04_12565 [Opitutus sp.]
MALSHRYAPHRDWLGRILIGALLAGSGMGGVRAEENEITAISSKVSDDYIRTKQSGGSFQPETYSFGQGGHWTGNRADLSIDKLTILDVGHVIAVPLAGQQYFPSHDPQTTKLLIMVYWGTTRPPEHPSSSASMRGGAQASVNLSIANGALKNATMVKSLQGGASLLAGAQEDLDEAQSQMSVMIMTIAMENKIRDRDDRQNVKLLGFDSDWNRTHQDYFGSRLGAMRIRQQDIVDELEEARYFVVLMAYDFQLMWKQKKTKLLWETRFSIREHGNEFDRQLSAMAQQAAKYFGQDSKGVLRKPLPNVRVDLGETKVVGFDAKSKK